MAISDNENGFNELIDLQKKILAALDRTDGQKTDPTELLKYVAQRIDHLTEKAQQLVEERDGLYTLAEIGGSLTTTLDSDAILQKMVDSIIQLAEAERCFLMLLDGEGTTHVQIGRNWKQETLSPQEKAISTTIVNQVIEDREAVLTTNAETDPRFDGTESVVNFKIRSVMCVPLIYQDNLLGVLYADHRLRSEQFSKAKIDLLSKFANQAAIALHNAKLYEHLQETHMELQNTHSELEEAYDTTLEGWAKVLELRDPATEGHTQRVVSLSMRLAKRMGINGSALVNLRRGAVLHDIGKMAIPDEVLTKPGALTEEEIQIMRMHPQLAVEMLSQIKFLRNALAVPYYHHEHWDGSGYPKGLAGEKIPLSARIFAVVDVWDALTSERPYRKALSPEDALGYIEKGAGKHFDPAVVEAFVKLIKE